MEMMRGRASPEGARALPFFVWSGGGRGGIAGGVLYNYRCPVGVSMKSLR